MVRALGSTWRLPLAALGVLIGACDGEPPCGPSAGGPYWLEEGQAFAATVVCDSGAPVPAGATLAAIPPGRPTDREPIPAGLSFDPATGAMAWTPGLDQAAVYDLEVTLPGPDGVETTTLVIGVADAFDDPANVPVRDPGRYREEFGLPVVFLDPGPQDPEVYAPTTIVYRGRLVQAEAKKRGASSLSYPKNSYTLKFPDDDRLDEAAFPARKKLVLTSTFDDNSYLRQRLAFATWNQMSATHLPIGVDHAVVYADGVYLGLYLVSDHVDDDLMVDHGLAATGNLYKAYNHDANFRRDNNDGDGKATLADGYEKKAGLPDPGQPGAFADLEDLVAWVADADTAGFRAEVDTRLERADFADWWVLVTLIAGDDSAGKNAYLYHDAAGGGRWRYLPWDFNHSFGQTWETLRQPADAQGPYRQRNQIFVHLLDDPGYRQELRDRIAALLAGPLAASTVQAQVDAWWATIEPSARRDWRAWAGAYRTFPRWASRTDLTDVDGELAYLRAWIDARWAHAAVSFPDD